MREDRKIENTAIIDGQQVKVRKGQTILDAALKAGIHVPTLCHLEHLEPYGGCRLCVVDVKNMKGFPTACTTPLEPGMEIKTNTPELQKLRRNVLEFTLSEHPFTCLVCKDKKACTDYMHTTRKVSTITGCNFCTSNGDCELQDLVDYLDLTDVSFPIRYRGIPPVKDNPFYDLDYNLCVLCGRCVRICNEERHSNVLAFVERGNSTIVGTAFQESQHQAGCEYCGACVDVCPTGSISEKMGKWRGIPNKSVKTTCTICPVACEMNVNSIKGELVQIGPATGKRISPPQLCLRGKFLPADLNHHPSRITTPLLKKGGRWVEISWKEAFAKMAGELESHRGDKFGLIASAQDTLEDNYALQKFARKVMHSNNVDLHASYHRKEVPEHLHHYHSHHPPVDLEKIEKADTLLIIGLDASISHPLLENRIRKAFMNGKQVIYANPIPTRTSTFVSSELRYEPGGEDAFIRALASALTDKSGKTSLTEQEISVLRTTRDLVIIAGDDLLRHPSAIEIIQTLMHLHHEKCRDHQCKIFFPGFEGGLYGNVLAGMHPEYLPGFYPLGDEKAIRKWNMKWGARLNSASGLSGNEMIQGIAKKGPTALMVVGDLPMHPNLEKLDFLVQFNMFRTKLSESADLLLPLTDFLENDGHILALDGKLKKLNKAVTRPGKTKSIAGIVSGLSTQMGVAGFSSKPADLFREMRSMIEFPAGISNKVMPKGEIIKTKQKKGDDSYPVRIVLRHSHFAYRNNPLSEWIPELKFISQEGMIGLSSTLMKQLKVKEGARVRVLTKKGESEMICMSMPETADHTAWLFPNGNGTVKLSGEISPGNNILFARIEKT